MIENWNADRFKSEVYQKGSRAAVEFYSDTCPACRGFGIVLDTVSEKYAGKMLFGKVNVVEEEALAEKYAIRSVPTLMVFVNGRCIAEQVGSVGCGELSSIIDRGIEKA